MFSQNRRRRFAESGVLEQSFDETVKPAMAEGLVSRHVGADGSAPEPIPVTAATRCWRTAIEPCRCNRDRLRCPAVSTDVPTRSEEHTSELQSHGRFV